MQHFWLSPLWHDRLWSRGVLQIVQRSIRSLTMESSMNIGQEGITLWWTNILQLKMAIEIVDFPIKNQGSHF